MYIYLNMKKIKFVLTSAAIAASVFLAVSCDKSSQNLTGSYTYKISGSLTLASIPDGGEGEPAGPDGTSVTVALNPEQGQMHVVEESEGNFLVTFNDILGNVDVSPAKINGNELTLSGTQKKTIQFREGVISLDGGMVTYGGSGKLLDDMLILNMEYGGQLKVGGVSMTIAESNVVCVAQHN